MERVYVICCNDAILAVAEGSEDFANQLRNKMKARCSRTQTHLRENFDPMLHSIPFYRERKEGGKC